MGIIRGSTAALRKLSFREKYSHGSQRGRRSLAQLSQTMLKVEQPAVSRPSTKDPVTTWLLPATLALLGLSFSTFCTHQLVSKGSSGHGTRSLAPGGSPARDGDACATTSKQE